MSYILNPGISLVSSLHHKRSVKALLYSHISRLFKIHINPCSNKTGEKILLHFVKLFQNPTYKI